MTEKGDLREKNSLKCFYKTLQTNAIHRLYYINKLKIRLNKSLNREKTFKFNL